MQKIKNKISRIFLLNFLLLFSATQNSFAAPSRNLTVFAEQNLSFALTKIARLYSQKSNAIVSLNFNSSYDLINEVESGEPADVFISAHTGLIESLHQKGWVDVYNVGYIASDELVLVTSKTNPTLPAELSEKKLSLEESLKILNHNKSELIIDSEGTSSGKFSADFLEKFPLENIRLYNKLSEDKSPLLSTIKNNQENYALLLASQVKTDKDLEIIARKKDEKIFYQALVIAGDNMEIAREFLQFLKSDQAKTILKQSGFITN